MKIAQIAPLYESVPPKLYGGTERVIYHLTEELVRQGHDVTLYASGDSKTSARLKPQCLQALRLDPRITDPLAHHVVMAEKISREMEQYDIVHSHADYLLYPAIRRSPVPCVTTLHLRLDLPDLVPLYLEYADVPLVSISYAQRAPVPWANWQKTVHHGIARDSYSFHASPGGYLAFLGRVSPEKRLVDAIEIAKRAGLPLKIAAKIDAVDEEYFSSRIRPLLDHPLIEFLGEISEERKNDFLGNARALIFPIDWPEPFGMVMIEALACGTPVIARRRGSVPEIIEHGASGFIIDTIDEAVAAVSRLPAIDRRACRQAFEDRFTASRMAGDYLALYEEMIEKGSSKKPVAPELYGSYSS